MDDKTQNKFGGFTLNASISIKDPSTFLSDAASKKSNIIFSLNNPLLLYGEAEFAFLQVQLFSISEKNLFFLIDLSSSFFVVILYRSHPSILCMKKPS
ncbi:MAG: hypothetical protein V1769_06885 [Thermoplasmatota archaeon]